MLVLFRVSKQRKNQRMCSVCLYVCVYAQQMGKKMKVKICVRYIQETHGQTLQLKTEQQLNSGTLMGSSVQPLKMGCGYTVISLPWDLSCTAAASRG